MIKVRTLLACAAVVGLSVATADAAQTLRIQSSFNSGDFANQYIIKNWLPKVPEMTNGEVEIELLPSGAVVPAKETADVITAGVLDGDFTTPIYFSGKNPAFAILGDLTAAYDSPMQQMGFCKDGSGEAVHQKVYDKVFGGKIKVVACGPYTRESLTATVEINGVDALQGKKVRTPQGLTSEVFRRAGATPVNIPYSEVYTALQTGIVEAADASAYVNNDAAGLNKIATFPIYPGIHSQAVMQLALNSKKWDSLSEAAQKGLRDWWYAAMEDLSKVAHEEDEKLASRDRAGDAITVVDWAQAERDKFREIAKEAWSDYAGKSPEAKEALDAHISYMQSIGLLK
ncbi:TRAP transporter substrate-binding protein DctP [uncultured Cohaesibacter sp.]|uniref:TRAP transporter substrate-binding protein DctP n=1 Tax=uncultured Cohaesibacter sp. TaxID=1002546 RepID=UPI0029C8F16D|nr:TRAP transporter substrate-binding protein DctP [uncultured Cohaesibacter sp.]